jgi:uncharacterized alkaline shock family protein YloU
MPDRAATEPEESVHSPAASAHISHAVIATYAAAAAREVAGVFGMAAGHFGPPERRADPERAPKAVRVSSDADGVDLELHVIAEFGAPIRSIAGEVEREVRRYLRAMLDLDLRHVAVIVDDVAQPSS